MVRYLKVNPATLDLGYSRTLGVRGVRDTLGADKPLRQYKISWLEAPLAIDIMSGTPSFLALEGFHVFITGAAGGIGSQAVREFLCEYEPTLSTSAHYILIHLIPSPRLQGYSPRPQTD